MKSWQDAEDATLATASAASQQATAATIAVCGAGMARKKRRARRGATTYATDEKLIAYLEEHAPEVLQTQVSESVFGAAVEAVLNEPSTDEIRHFYCRPCGEYHLKTHPHHAEMKERRAKGTMGSGGQRRSKKNTRLQKAEH
jgi:hypothetical protein